MLEKFRNLAKEISANPKVKLLTYKEYAPLTLQEIESIEKKLPASLPSELKEFYLQTNGLSFGWIHQDDDSASYADLKEMELPKDFSKAFSKIAPVHETNYTNQSGSIELLGLREVFQDPLDLNEILFDENFYVIDAFSNISGAAISLAKPNKWMISFNNDYYTHFDDYQNAMRFDEYLHFLIDSKGIKGMRNYQENMKLLDVTLNNWASEFKYYE